MTQGQAAEDEERESPEDTEDANSFAILKTEIQAFINSKLEGRGRSVRNDIAAILMDIATELEDGSE